MEKIRVLLAEDQRIVRAGVRMLIDAEPDMRVVAESDAGMGLIGVVKEVRPDVVVLGVTLPELNGRNTVVELKRELPAVKVLTLTCHTDDFYIQHFLHAGTNGYVLKQSSPSELLHAIRLLAAGQCYLDPTITQRVLMDRAAQGTKLRGDVCAHLTSREIEVLRLAAFSYSNKEIAARLDVSPKTVEAHKHHAMKKLNLRNRGEIVRYGLLQGWLEERWDEEC